MKPIEEILNFDQVRNILSRYADTTGGKDYCSKIQWYTNGNKILTLLDELDDAITLVNKIPDLSLSGLENNNETLNKLIPSNSYIKPEEILRIYSNLQIARTFKNGISKYINDLGNIKEYFIQVINLKDLEKEIERVIDINENTIKDSASPALAEIRKSLYEIQRKVKREIEKIVSDESLQNMLMEGNLFQSIE